MKTSVSSVPLWLKSPKPPRGTKAWGRLGLELRCMAIHPNGNLICRHPFGSVTLTPRQWRKLPRF